MFLRFLLISLLFVGVTHASQHLSDLRKETHNPLYFSVPLAAYKIISMGKCDGEKECSVVLEADVAFPEIEVITDRPVRDETQISLEEFRDFVNSSDESLVFSLELTQGGKTKSLNFKKKRVTFDPKTNRICFQSHMNNPENTLAEALKDTGILQGEEAVLIVEG